MPGGSKCSIFSPSCLVCANIKSDGSKKHQLALTYEKDLSFFPDSGMNFANFWPTKSKQASLCQNPLKQGAQYGVRHACIDIGIYMYIIICTSMCICTRTHTQICITLYVVAHILGRLVDQIT